MKKFLAALALLVFTNTVFSQTTEDFDAIVKRFQRYYNEQKGDSIYYNMFSEKLQASVSVNRTVAKFRQYYSTYGPMQWFQYNIAKEGQIFYITVHNNSATLSLMMSFDYYNRLKTIRLTPVTVESTVKHTANFFLPTATSNIYGVLTEPAALRKVPVILIIPEAGPTDRNGNSYSGTNSNNYKIIADSLLKAGYGCLRYDKRGIGESIAVVTNEDSVTFDDMVNDAARLVKMLKSHWHFSKVILLGHGEGSLIGMRVAQIEKVGGFISVEGTAQREDKVIIAETRKQSKKLSKQVKTVFDSLMAGYTVNTADSAVNSICPGSQQEYFRSWLKYTPADEIKKLNIPVLILHGSTDLLVAEKEATKLKKAKEDATLTIIEGMNYMLKEAPADEAKNIATYANPDLPLCPGLMPAVLQFVRERK